jgi:FixJ family two-component response regulator
MHGMDTRHLVAIVDDEQAVRLAVARMLQASSLYHVMVFESGQTFLNSLRTVVPDCVVLDFQMPELTGSDVQRALKNSQIEVPVIVMTAHDQPTLRAQCMADGASAYFTKPLRRDDLMAAIDTAILAQAD